MVHSFYFDYNNEGHYMWIAIESHDVDCCRRYLEQYSRDVRYHKTKHRTKEQRGCRKLPCGLVVAANLLDNNKIDSFGRDKKIYADVDSRMAVAEWD